MSLPSYQEALARPSIPSLVAPYLDLSTLRSASRVNKAWSRDMNRQLWGDALKSFSNSTHPFQQMTRFLEEAAKYRPDLREMITTIDLRPLLARQHAFDLRQEFAKLELDIGYRRILQHCLVFHNLRFLVLDELTRKGECDQTGFHCPNTRILLLSARGISLSGYKSFLSLPEFRDLMYLDLSYTSYSNAFEIPLEFKNLRIAKLRGLRLTKIPQFILDRGTSLWSLDVRDNLLTGDCLGALYQHCFQKKHAALAGTDQALNDVHYLYESPPVYHRTSEEDLTTADFLSIRPDSTDAFINYFKENCDLYKAYPSSRILPGKDPIYIHSGLTQLYISGNKLNSGNVNFLLSTQNRLQVLDIGSVRAGTLQYKTMYAVWTGCEMITPLYGCRLEQLRIHHSAVTRIPNILSSDSAVGYDLESLKQAENMARKDWSNRLTPLSHHRLKSLTLTDIPTKSYGPLIRQLTLLLKECADQEEKLAAVRDTMSPSRRAPQVLSGLKTLRLEFLPEVAAPAPEASSVSGDRDADGFLARSLGDFSFFGGSGGAEWVEKKGTGAGKGGKGGKGKEKGKEKREVEPEDVVEALRGFRRAQKPAGWGGTLELVWPRGR
ncbi:uncharacterized protein LY89DRAFT_729072 [Mollisia scopiformis]|uniref:Uncharacterized protein n=1 Tax=Mollisia scopiformis TaxID=149040 RepID=A0A194XN17_MOLSC|nr:uncharacterized protein LY89DRAFT_729072 [Mollisia scopiformis]KUJ21553.1 hypothetical protein LY89DRAFT_729072 [Mollisia scopiformis]